MTAAKNQKLGYDEYVLFPDDGQRHEIVDGDHFMNPAPSTYHQTISKRLQYQQYTKIELSRLGLVFVAPIDVQLDQYNIVQPDLVVVLNESRANVAASRIIGAPELLVEIESPSTAANDQKLKRRVYEQSGVAEYWIISPEDQTVAQLVLQDGRYVGAPQRFDAQPMQPTILPQVEISFREIW